MSSLPLPVKVVSLLARPSPAVMATVGSDGRPVTAATWFLLERDHRILFALDAGRSRVHHLHRDPRVSLTVLASDGGHTHVTVQGRIDGVFEDEGFRDIDRIAMRYTGQPYPERDRDRVSFRLTIDDWRLEKREFGVGALLS